MPRRWKSKKSRVSRAASPAAAGNDISPCTGLSIAMCVHGPTRSRDPSRAFGPPCSTTARNELSSRAVAWSYQPVMKNIGTPIRSGRSSDSAIVHAIASGSGAARTIALTPKPSASSFATCASLKTPPS